MPRRPKSTSSSATAGSTTGSQRLQRILASAGYGSRRQCEELIEEGRVEVDGEVVTKLGTTADANEAKIRVDGVLLKRQKLVYYAVNKPVGFVTTNSDPEGRPRVIDLVPPNERVFPVGRLDRSSEGLILLTNDGELAQKLAHPKFGIQKVYRVTVAGNVDADALKKMRQGIYISEGRVRVDGAKVLRARPRATEMEITLREGKNREIRRILARLGHKVQTLRRIAVGPLRLGDTPPGAYRPLTREELHKLQAASEQATKMALTEKPKKPTRSPAGEKTRPTKTTSKAAPKRATAKSKTDDIVIRIKRDSESRTVIGAEPKPKRERRTPKVAKRSTTTRDNKTGNAGGPKKRVAKKGTGVSRGGKKGVRE